MTCNVADKVRRQEHKALLQQGEDRLKGIRYLWLFREENMPAKHQPRLMLRLLTKSSKTLVIWRGFCYESGMLRKRGPQQLKYEFVCIERLVPQDHLLRKIARYIDFRFIHDKVKDLYCPDNGRPALDPTVLFKMLFLGYLFGIRSERRLVEEIKVNVAYRWFLGFTLEDRVPDASTISQNRRRRFNHSTVYQEIFDEIVVQAMRRKMIDGRVLYTDSTHLKASANKNKFIEAQAARSTRDYIDDLERDIAQDRVDHGKKPLPQKETTAELKTVKQSTTDPESGYMHRDGKPKGFFYLDHRTVDGQHGLVTDTFVTPGNVHDSIPYLDRLDRLDRQRQRFGFEVLISTLIEPVIGTVMEPAKESNFRSDDLLWLCVYESSLQGERSDPFDG